MIEILDLALMGCIYAASVGGFVHMFYYIFWPDERETEGGFGNVIFIFVYFFLLVAALVIAPVYLVVGMLS